MPQICQAESLYNGCAFHARRRIDPYDPSRRHRQNSHEADLTFVKAVAVIIKRKDRVSRAE